MLLLVGVYGERDVHKREISTPAANLPTRQAIPEFYGGTGMGDTPLDITHEIPFDSSSAPKMATNKVRLYALTGAVAAITATGAWYGAGLNMRQELKEVCHLSPSQSIMYTYLPINHMCMPTGKSKNSWSDT